jgi:hypothetical protein
MNGVKIVVAVEHSIVDTQLFVVGAPLGINSSIIRAYLWSMY